MARAEVKVALPTLDRIVPPAQRKALLAHLAALQVGRIKRRTGQGVDVNGKPFKPYSFGYSVDRHRAGRTVKPVTLTLTGAMLGSMQVLNADEHRAVIGFAGSSAAVRLTKRARAAKNRKTGDRITHTFKETTRQVSNALKAYWNDKGDTVAGYGVPKRHFFGFSAADKVFLAKTAIRELTRMAGQITLARFLGKR